MSKKQTPMRKLQHHFGRLEYFAGKPLELNKSSPKYNPHDYTYSKGIANEFVRVYSQPSSTTESLGFAFNGINTDVPLITVDFRGGVFVGERIFGYDRFKELMLRFVSTLELLYETSTVDFGVVMRTAFKAFGFKEGESGGDVLIEEQIAKFKQLLESDGKAITRLTKEYKALGKESLAALKIFEARTATVYKKLGIQHLKSQVDEAEKVLKETVKMEKRASVAASKGYYKKQNHLSGAIDRYNERRRKLLETLPPSARNVSSAKLPKRDFRGEQVASDDD